MGVGFGATSSMYAPRPTTTVRREDDDPSSTSILPWPAHYNVLCEVRKMRFSVAIRTQKTTFFRFRKYCLTASVGERTGIELEPLHMRVDVVPCQRGIIAIVSALPALPAKHLEELQLATQGARLLRAVALMMMVRVGVLATPGAILCLPTGKFLVTDDAAQRLHMNEIISCTR